MKVVHLNKKRAEFEPVMATEKSQAAIMQLSPGGASDEERSNEHPRSEQWVYVVAGRGEATIVSGNNRRRRVTLRRGSLLVIEPGELHQIRNTGTTVLNTLNIYVPPAYRTDGRILKRR